MDENELAIVRFALALHLGRDPDAIHAGHRLDADLGLDALDLVLVVLRLEELGDAEFPVADLEGLRTVGDLVALVERWVREDPLARADRDTIRTAPTRAPAPLESGFHVVATGPRLRGVG